MSFPFTGVPGAGTAYGSIIVGVAAPKREFNDVEARLVASLDTFTVMNGLQLLPDDDLELWTSAPADGSTIH